MITLTDSARDYLKSVSNGDFVSLGVKGGGCSGMQYVWDFSKNWPDVDWSEPIDNVLVVDRDANTAAVFLSTCPFGWYLK